MGQGALADIASWTDIAAMQTHKQTVSTLKITAMQPLYSGLGERVPDQPVTQSFNPGDLRLDFARVLRQASLPKIRFHDLRHTAASLMLNHVIPVIVVSKILGHSKPSITMDIYGHLCNEMQGEAPRLMDELVSPVKVNLPTKMLQETSTGEM